MSEQVISPELRDWVLAQIQAGHEPPVVLSSMEASGWQRDVALRALEDVLNAELMQLRDEPGALPDIDAGSPNRVFAHDREVSIQACIQHPRVVIFSDLLSHAECDELVELARPRLSRSETVQQQSGGSEVNAARTSQGMFFGRGENPLCQRIEARLSALLHWPVENGEGLQVLRYLPGAEYRPHYDYFDPSQPGTQSILKRGGQRVGTVVMYLNTPTAGGATTFPDAGISVQPVKGSAVFFSYPLPLASTKTLHGGAPVLDGEKWVATKWMREGAFT